MIKKALSVAVTLLICLLAMAFGAENNASTELVMFDWVTPAWPLYIWLMLVFVIGALVGYFAAKLAPHR